MGTVLGQYTPYTPVVIALLDALHKAGYKDWDFERAEPHEVFGGTKGFHLVPKDPNCDYWFCFECLEGMNQISLFYGAYLKFQSTCNLPAIQTAVRVFVSLMEGSNDGEV